MTEKKNLQDVLKALGLEFHRKRQVNFLVHRVRFDECRHLLIFSNQPGGKSHKLLAPRGFSLTPRFLQQLAVLGIELA